MKTDLNKDQRKQIATITTTTASIALSALITVLYLSAIVILQEEENGHD